jgi:hypothetical protein
VAHSSAYRVRALLVTAGASRQWPVASRMVLTRSQSIDVYYGGAGQIIGTVKIDDTPTDIPLARKVRLFRDRDAACVGETWSDAAGNYAFQNIDPAERYTALAYAFATDQFESVCASGLTPEAMP